MGVVADDPQRLDDSWAPLGVAMHHSAVEQIQAERSQIGEDEWLGCLGMELGQHKGADDSRYDAGDRNPEEQPPVDVAVGHMADRRGSGRKRLGRVDSDRSEFRLDPNADQ